MTNLTQASIAHIAPIARSKSFAVRLFTMAALARQRRALRALEPHLLNDIGLTKREAEQEANRPIWDAPETWLNAR